MRYLNPKEILIKIKTASVFIIDREEEGSQKKVLICQREKSKEKTIAIQIGWSKSNKLSNLAIHYFGGQNAVKSLDI